MPARLFSRTQKIEKEKKKKMKKKKNKNEGN